MLEDVNDLGLEDYTGFYIVDTNGSYIDGPFDDNRVARHEYDIHREEYAAYRTIELTHDEYVDRWFM